MSETGTRIYLDWGWIEYGKDEVTVASTIENPTDTPKFRLASISGSGAVSFNKLRPDGKQDELALLKCGMETFGPMVVLFVNDGRGSADSNMKRILEASHEQGLTVFV